VAAAPRGTLLHHYRVDHDGIVQWANLVIATGHNNAVIRCYDPCLSCSTHAIGQMPLHLQLLAADGTVLDERKR
jgi:NAD-reducing hydrogenase large subunit